MCPVLPWLAGPYCSFSPVWVRHFGSLVTGWSVLDWYLDYADRFTGLWEHRFRPHDGTCTCCSPACAPACARRMAAVEADDVLSLLALPDPCLLAVLKCCAANDQRSVLSAARAHSRLHQAAVLALRSIKADANRQEQVDSVLLYLGKLGQWVGSVSIDDERWRRHPLTLSVPTGLTVQLRSWQLKNILLVDKEFRGVLGPTLTQLQLKVMRSNATGDATVEALAAALSQLVSLEHLGLTGRSHYVGNERFELSTALLQQLQQLTYLELDYIHLLPFNDGSPILKPLQALTGLQDLRVKNVRNHHLIITASMLSGLHQLARLELAECGKVEPVHWLARHACSICR